MNLILFLTLLLLTKGFHFEMDCNFTCQVLKVCHFYQFLNCRAAVFVLYFLNADQRLVNHS